MNNKKWGCVKIYTPSFFMYKGRTRESPAFAISENLLNSLNLDIKIIVNKICVLI